MSSQTVLHMMVRFVELEQFTLYLLVTVKFGQCCVYWVGSDCVAFLSNIESIASISFLNKGLTITQILLNIMTSLHLFVYLILAYLR